MYVKGEINPKALADPADQARAKAQAELDAENELEIGDDND